jgi:WD40 repeat protein
MGKLWRSFGMLAVFGASLETASIWAQAPGVGRSLLELQFIDRPARDPKDGKYPTCIAVAGSKDGTVVFYSLRREGLFRWDLPQRPEKRFERRVMPSVEGPNITNMLACENGRTLLVCYNTVPLTDIPNTSVQAISPYVEVWDVPSNKVLFTLKSNTDRSVFSGGTLSRDGKTVVIPELFGGELLGKGGTLRRGGNTRVGFWDIATEKQTRILTGLSGPLALSSDGKLLAATQSKDIKTKKLLLVDAKTSEVRVTLKQPKHAGDDDPTEWSPGEFLFSPSDNFVAGRERRRGWVVWDMKGKIVLGEEPKDRPSALCFLPEADNDGREWITRTAWVQAIAVSSDGKLFVAGEDGAIRVWERKPARK